MRASLDPGPFLRQCFEDPYNAIGVLSSAEAGGCQVRLVLCSAFGLMLATLIDGEETCSFLLLFAIKTCRLI